MKLPKLKHHHDYLAEMHLYVDDIRHLEELRDKAVTLEEKLEYSRNIEGAKKVLAWLQEETTK